MPMKTCRSDNFLSDCLKALFFWIFTAILGLLYYPSRGLLRRWRSLAGTLNGALIVAQHSSKVVVVGGGFAGSYIAKALEHAFDVTLVDTKDYFEFTPSVLRTIVDRRKLGRIQVLHTDYLLQAVFVRGQVQEVCDGYILLNDGDRLNFDYLCLCTGSTYAHPLKEANTILSTRSSHLVRCHDELDKATRPLIIGGGTVGVELAAEVVGQFGHAKSITIATSGRCLMPRAPLYAQYYAESYFKRHSVTLLFDQRVVGFKQSMFHTQSGTIIEADIAFVCTGITPNTSFLRNGKWENATDEKGFIRVNSCLQVEGESSIFAVGDVNSIPGEKLAQVATKQAEIAAKNILELQSANEVQREANLLLYDPIDVPMIVSLGAYDAVLCWKGYSMTGFIPALLKECVEWKEMVVY